MEVNYNMLIQNHFHHNILYKKITLWAGGATVKKWTLRFGGEELKSPHLQLRLPWLFK